MCAIIKLLYFKENFKQYIYLYFVFYLWCYVWSWKYIKGARFDFSDENFLSHDASLPKKFSFLISVESVKPFGYMWRLYIAVAYTLLCKLNYVFTILVIFSLISSKRCICCVKFTRPQGNEKNMGNFWYQNLRRFLGKR